MVLRSGWVGSKLKYYLVITIIATAVLAASAPITALSDSSNFTDDIVKYSNTLTLARLGKVKKVIVSGNYVFALGDYGVAIGKVSNYVINYLGSIPSEKYLSDMALGKGSLATLRGDCVVNIRQLSNYMKYREVRVKGLMCFAIDYSGGSYYVLGVTEGLSRIYVSIVSEGGKLLKVINLKPLSSLYNKKLDIKVIGNYAYIAVATPSELTDTYVIDVSKGSLVGRLVKSPATPKKPVLFIRAGKLIDVSNPVKPRPIELSGKGAPKSYKALTQLTVGSSKYVLIFTGESLGVAKYVNNALVWVGNVAGPLIGIKVGKDVNLLVGDYVKLGSSYEYSIPNKFVMAAASVSNSLGILYSYEYSSLILTKFEGPSSNYGLIAKALYLLPVGFSDFISLGNGYTITTNGWYVLLTKAVSGGIKLVGGLYLNSELRINGRKVILHVGNIIPDVAGKGTLLALSDRYVYLMKLSSKIPMYELIKYFKLSKSVDAYVSYGGKVYALVNDRGKKLLTINQLDLSRGKLVPIKTVNYGKLGVRDLIMSASTHRLSVLATKGKLVIPAELSSRYVGLLITDLRSGRTVVIRDYLKLPTTLGDSGYVVASTSRGLGLAIVNVLNGRVVRKLTSSDLGLTGWSIKSIRATELGNGKYIVVVSNYNEVKALPIIISSSGVKVGRVVTLRNSEGKVLKQVSNSVFALSKDTLIVNDHNGKYIYFFKLSIGKYSEEVKTTKTSTTKSVTTSVTQVRTTARTTQVAKTSSSRVSTSTSVTKPLRTSSSTVIKSVASTTKSVRTASTSTTSSTKTELIPTSKASEVVSKAKSVANTVIDELRKNPVLAVVAIALVIAVIAGVAKAVRK